MRVNNRKAVFASVKVRKESHCSVFVLLRRNFVPSKLWALFYIFNFCMFNLT